MPRSAPGARLVLCSARRLFASLVVLLTAKAAREERSLAEKFNDYSQYAAAAPRIVPLPGSAEPLVVAVPGRCPMRRRKEAHLYWTAPGLKSAWANTNSATAKTR